MHFSLAAAASLLAASVIAAPAPAKSTASTAYSLTVPTSLAQLVAEIDSVVATNAASHGKAHSPGINVTKTSVSSARHSHSINWPKGVQGGEYLNWTTFKGNGANLGGWLEKEQNIDPFWWDALNPDAPDEWTLCESLGSNCSAAFESRYASFITTADIDKLGSVGVNILRIPTTYAAWINFPGSQLYHGNQQTYLRTITEYAIKKYNMHIIVGLHSLPGGVNTLGIGEAFGHDAWFQNTTNLYYSFLAVEKIVAFIETSKYPNAFSIAPINEASDNFADFATPAGLTTDGVNWINTYIHGVLAILKRWNPKIPVVLQDCFLGESFWSPFYAAGTNLVIDSHVYYFAASGIYSQYVAPAICGQASTLSGDGKFPVFVGEWSLQTLYNNTLAGRKVIADTERYAWSKYVSGGSFWNGQGYYGNTTVDGEGVLEDYWNYELLIDQGVITTTINSSYC